MAAGREVFSKDCSPMQTEHGNTEHVSRFHIQSTIEASGRSDLDVYCRIAKVSKALGVLFKAVMRKAHA